MIDDRTYIASPSAAQEPASDPAPGAARRQYLVARQHALGPAPLFHFLNEIERGADIRATLEINASLPADLIRAYGGDQFPAPFVIDRSATP